MEIARQLTALRAWLSGKLAKNIDQFAYWFVFVNLFMGGILLMFFPSALAVFLREDSIAETLGAFFLFLTAPMLFYSAYVLNRQDDCHGRKDQIRMILFILAGLAFFWAAGEEISWGQRIFGLATPESLIEVNQQKEINLHNLNTRFFNNGLETIILLVIIVPAICKMAGKEQLFGVVLPSYSVIMSFQLISCYVTYSYIKSQDYLSYLVLLCFLILFFRSKDWEKLEQVLLSFSLVIFMAFVNVSLRDSFPSNGPREFREYLFSFLCFIYSLKIALDFKSGDSSGLNDQGRIVI